jgi:glycosyltransferase involved in cell wall biosynthesis
MPPPPRSRRPIGVVVHAYYEEDARVRRQTQALVAAGWPVHVFALRRPGDPSHGELDGARIHRLNVQRHQGAGAAVYLMEYAAFLARATWALAAAHRRSPFALVQVHSIPDALVFAALPVRLAGIPVLLDLHEAMPEFFRLRFPGPGGQLALPLVSLQERLALRAADALLTVNDALRTRLVALGVAPERVTVVANVPPLAAFDPHRYPHRPFAADGTVRLVYAGALSPVYELDVVFEALARLRRLRPPLAVTLDVYGRDYGESPLGALADRLGIADRVRFHGRIPLEAVPEALAAADIALAPTRRTPFTELSLSTKLFEALAMEKPVLASRLPLVEATLGSDAVTTYRPGDPDDLAAQLLRLVDDPAYREAVATTGATRARQRSWEVEAARYLAVVESLVGRRPRPMR